MNVFSLHQKFRNNSVFAVTNHAIHWVPTPIIKHPGGCKKKMSKRQDWWNASNLIFFAKLYRPCCIHGVSARSDLLFSFNEGLWVLEPQAAAYNWKNWHFARQIWCWHSRGSHSRLFANWDCGTGLSSGCGFGHKNWPKCPRQRQVVSSALPSANLGGRGRGNLTVLKTKRCSESTIVQTL